MAVPAPSSPAKTSNGTVMPIASGKVQKLSATKVQQLVDAGKTPRTLELGVYQAYFEGNAYEGRPHFFSDDIPMQERKPCIVYPIAKMAAESNVAFAMGEGRFPVVLAYSSENDDVFDKDLGLSTDDSAVLDSFNSKLIDQARLEQAFRQGYRMAMASRSVAFVLGFRNGLPFADLVWSKLCTPSFDDPSDPTKCTRLEIRYRYVDTFRSQALTGGESWPVVYEYLRVVDDTYDTVYKPVQIWDVTDPGVVDRQSATATVDTHGFGICPVHWYARNRESVVGVNYDGKAIHEGLCSLIEQLDMSLSQRHRAAIYAGDPQTVLTGLTEEDSLNGGSSGRRARPNDPQVAGDLGPNAANWDSGFRRSLGGGGGVTKRGVMHPWRLKDPAAKAMLLTLPGDALKALDDDATDLTSRVCDGLGIVMMDPTSFKGGGDLSGRTLSFIFSKQINRVSQDREDVGRCCILPVLNLFYRMVVARSAGVYIAGLKKVLPILQRFYKRVDKVDNPVWFCPQLKLKWGDYFEPSDVDEATRVGTAIQAYGAKLITMVTAVEHMRGVFAIGSVDQYVVKLQQEIAQRQADAVASQQAMVGALHGPDDDSAAPKGPQPPNLAKMSLTATPGSKPQVAKTKRNGPT